MKKLIKYSLIAGLGVFAVSSLASCTNEGKYFADYEVTAKETDSSETKYLFKIYNEKYGFKEASQNTTTAASTTSSTEVTTAEEEEAVDDSIAKKWANQLTEGRQVILSSFVSTSQSAQTISIPKTVEINGQDYTVTAIGAAAFLGAKDLVQITVPETVSIIEDSAFSYCSALTTITYEGEIVTFESSVYDQSNKLDVITYKGKTLIQGVASGIKSLRTVNLPNVETIGAKGLNGDSYLQTINLGETGTLKTIGEKAFDGMEHYNVTAWGCGGDTAIIKDGTTFEPQAKWPTYADAGMGGMGMDDMIYGQYYTLDVNGYTYTKVDTDSVTKPQDGVCYYKQSSSSAYLTTVTGKVASTVTITGKKSDNYIKKFVNLVPNKSEVTFNYK